MPGVHIFESFVGLLDGLVEMNAAAVSRVQLSHMEEIRAKVLPAFGAILRSLLTNQEPA